VAVPVARIRRRSAEDETFTRKVDADRYLVDVQRRIMSGTYVPPQAGMMTVADFAGQWVRRRHWRPATRERIERELRLPILPNLGTRPLASLRRSHIEEWAASLPLAPSSVGAVCQTFHAMLLAAVEDERIVRNPAFGAKLPVVEVAPFVPMTAEEVRRMAASRRSTSAAPCSSPQVPGLRQGESVRADRRPGRLHAPRTSR
jgi:integrase-like protein